MYPPASTGFWFDLVAWLFAWYDVYIGCVPVVFLVEGNEDISESLCGGYL